jgi:outer membrane protein assembly factor BamD (BamD/ComL family)
MTSPIFRLLGVPAVCFVMAQTGCGGSKENDGQPKNEVATEQPAAVAEEPAVVPETATEAELYEAAQKSERVNRPWDAIGLYRRILAEYPGSPQNYKAQFLIGFVFSEELDMPDSARVAYERVIQDYPQSEFADDAGAMLRFLNGEVPKFEESSAP